MAERPFTVIDCEQRSSEWFAARAGVLTASAAADMLAKPLRSGGEPAVRRDLRVRLALERLTGQPCEDTYVNAAMQRGIEMEAEARAAYELASGEFVREVGFLKHVALPVGCSPDGVIGDYEGGVEIKCPKSATHLGYWRSPDVCPAEYLPQVTHTLWLTGAPWWDFVSYDPRFPPALRLFLVRVKREDVDLKAYELTLRLFLDEVEKEHQEIAALAAERQREAA